MGGTVAPYAIAAGGCALGAIMGLTVHLPLYYEVVYHLTASQAGLALIPLAAISTCGAAIAGRTMARARHYKRVAIVGTSIAVVSGFALAFTTLPLWGLLALMSVFALGLGIGIRLSPSHSVRVEYQRPRSRLYEEHGNAFGPWFSHEVDRESSWSIMFAQSIGATGHPHLDILGGFTSLSLSTTGYITSQYRSVTGKLEDPFTLSTDDQTATATLSGGLDGVFPLTRRIALVPQIRVHTIVLGSAIRAGVALRFQF
jgi:MFS family permease